MMKKTTLLLLFIFSLPQAPHALAHEPIFGLGPHTMYQYGYAFSLELERGDQGWGNQLELLYGVTPDFSLTVVGPWLYADEQRGAGFGDMVVRGKYRFFRQDMYRASRQAALHGGIKFPSGNRDRQLGSGTTDFFVGASFGYESRRSYFFSGIRYHRNGTWQGFDRGDALRYNLAVGIRPWQLEYHQPDPVFILEVNGGINGRNKMSGQTISQSGGRYLSVGPGLLFSYRNIMYKAGVSVPVVQQFNDASRKASTEFLLAIEVHLPPIR